MAAMIDAPFRSLAALATTALLLGACGSDDPQTTTTSTTSTSSAATTTTTTGSGGTGGEGTGGGGVGGGSAGGGGSGGAAFSTAPHTPFPKLVFHGDAVMAHPKLVTITFPGYAHKAEVEAFGDYVVTSPWLSATGAEYGVSAGTHLAKVTLPDAAPAMLDDPGVIDLLTQRIADGTLPDGTVSDGVIYMLYVPGATVLEDDGTLCTDFVGYHWDAMASGKHIAYAVIGDCDGPLSDTTSTASHELIEAATDTLDSWYLDPAPDDPWVLFSGQENADLCQYLPNVVQDGVTLQRSWSDLAAQAGGDPCVPVPAGEPYFNVSASPATVPLVAAGSSVTFTLTGWSTAPMEAWSLSVDDTTLYDFVPTWELGAETINNGQTATLKLTVPAGTPSGQIGGVAAISGPGFGIYWPVTVMVK
jgi:hypothetical protein